MNNESEECPFQELQIIPASGWRAVFWDIDRKKVISRPITCFTLVQHTEDKACFIAAYAPSLKDRQYIEPVGDPDEDEPYVFLGYVGIGETPDDLLSELKENGEFPFTEDE